MSESQFKSLERKIDDLIGLCAELNQENVGLKAKENSWEVEKQTLVARNELAKTRVEAILNRLKAMEL